MNKKIVKISDKMQKNYKYELTEPVGKNFHPDFRPIPRRFRGSVHAGLSERISKGLVYKSKVCAKWNI